MDTSTHIDQRTPDGAAHPPHSAWTRNIHLGLMCCSIVANALLSGGIFTFPLLAPALAEHLRLTQPQLSTIALAGMMGQYPFAALIGAEIDRFGPGACSLQAAVLFLLGFGLFSNEIAHAPVYPDPASPLQYHTLVICFGMLGLGAVSSYFASLVCASKNFPQYSGAAAGTSMALFGLSPLFLSLIASAFFTDPVTGLNVTKFTAYVAVSAGVVHLVSAFFLRILPMPPATTVLHEESEDLVPDERSALIPKPVHEVLDLPPGQSGSLVALLSDANFWTLAFVSLCVLGICEALIANIGTIVISLPVLSPAMTNPNAVNTALQVRLISVSNTASRLLSGWVADFVSPVASHLSSGLIVFPRKHHISRVFFLCAASICLASALAWMLLKVETQKGVWILSLGTGVAYGTLWAILPGLVSAIWGKKNFGRNFGIVAYAPFIGTPLFSYLYAFVAAGANQGSDGVCQGHACWRLTFVVCEMAALAAFCGALWLWRGWKGLV